MICLTPENAVDELTFASYAHNRGLGISPEGFTKMGFRDVRALEQRFQLERIQRAEADSRAERAL